MMERPQINKIFSLILLISFIICLLFQNLLEIAEFYTIKFKNFESLLKGDKNYRIFSVPKGEFNKFKSKLIFKEDDEFWLDGKLYDILKTEEKDSNILMHCYEDNEELEFIEKIISKVEKKVFGLFDNINNIDLSKLKRLLDLQSVIFPSEIEFFNYNKMTLLIGKLIKYSPPILQVLKPPPNI